MNISKVSKGGDGGMMQTQVGTPYFICPEIYLKRPYSSTSDMWSLGGVLYNLAALHPPFLADK
jgi:NIMA (never in mitosis gene a)-related kinase